MSNATLNLIASEQNKLTRQMELRDQTKLRIEVLGETVRDNNNLERQENAIKVTKANIAKLNKYADSLKKG